MNELEWRLLAEYNNYHGTNISSLDELYPIDRERIQAAVLKHERHMGALHAEHEQRLQALHTRSETLRAKRAELAEVERELAELEREERAERELEEANSTEIDH